MAFLRVKANIHVLIHVANWQVGRYLILLHVVVLEYALPLFFVFFAAETAFSCVPLALCLSPLLLFMHLLLSFALCNHLLNALLTCEDTCTLWVLMYLSQCRWTWALQNSD